MKHLVHYLDEKESLYNRFLRMRETAFERIKGLSQNFEEDYQKAKQSMREEYETQVSERWSEVKVGKIEPFKF